MLAVAAIGLGILGGVLSGGAVSGIAGVRLKYEWAILAAFLAQGVARGRLPGTVASSASLFVWAAVSLLLALLLALNFRSAGALIAGAGVLLNLNVVILNHAMPVVAEASRASLAAVGAAGGFYRMAGPATVMAWAGDTIELGALGGRDLLSVGDILLVVGVAVMIAAAMLNATVDGGPPRAE